VGVRDYPAGNYLYDPGFQQIVPDDVVFDEMLI